MSEIITAKEAYGKLLVSSASWIVGYPRSGNTWMRFLIANILYPDKNLGHIDMNGLLPDIHNTSSWYKNGCPEFLIGKSHFITHKVYEDKKIIYIYRDGRDVALSKYHYTYHQGTKKTFQQYLHNDFIPGDRTWGGSWKEHIKAWVFGERKKDVFIISYEELHLNTFVVLKNIIKFLEFKVVDGTIKQAVEKSNLQRWRKMNADEGFHKKLVGLQGGFGGWKEKFTKEDREIFWLWAGDLMEKLGYKK